MKNFRIFITLCIINIFTLSLYAQPCDPADPDCVPTPEIPGTNGPGSQATPIDDYTIYLIGFAILIGVAYFSVKKYKKSLI